VKKLKKHSLANFKARNHVTAAVDLLSKDLLVAFSDDIFLTATSKE
jgi:hypothetical protein